MILDNQQQKDLLVNIVENVRIQGTYKELKKDIVILDDLMQAILNAKIEQEHTSQAS